MNDVQKAARVLHSPKLKPDSLESKATRHPTLLSTNCPVKLHDPKAWVFPDWGSIQKHENLRSICHLQALEIRAGKFQIKIASSGVCLVNSVDGILYAADWTCSATISLSFRSVPEIVSAKHLEIGTKLTGNAGRLIVASV
ncbi:hypothetical protein TMatcc_004464 [Talaromyces marneffei ATCC 18224]